MSLGLNRPFFDGGTTTLSPKQQLTQATAQVIEKQVGIFLQPSLFFYCLVVFVSWQEATGACLSLLRNAQQRHHWNFTGDITVCKEQTLFVLFLCESTSWDSKLKRVNALAGSKVDPKTRIVAELCLYDSANSKMFLGLVFGSGPFYMEFGCFSMCLNGLSHGALKKEMKLTGYSKVPIVVIVSPSMNWWVVQGTPCLQLMTQHKLQLHYRCWVSVYI